MYTRFSRKSNFLQIKTNIKTICTTQTDPHVSTTNTSKSEHFLPACEVKIILIFQHVNAWLSGHVCAGGNRLLGRCGAHSFLSQADFFCSRNADLTPIFPTQKMQQLGFAVLFEYTRTLKGGASFCKVVWQAEIQETAPFKRR